MTILVRTLILNRRKCFMNELLERSFGCNVNIVKELLHATTEAKTLEYIAMLQGVVELFCV